MLIEMSNIVLDTHLINVDLIIPLKIDNLWKNISKCYAHSFFSLNTKIQNSEKIYVTQWNREMVYTTLINIVNI